MLLNNHAESRLNGWQHALFHCYLAVVITCELFHLTSKALYNTWLNLLADTHTHTHTHTHTQTHTIYIIVTAPLVISTCFNWLKCIVN